MQLYFQTNLYKASTAHDNSNLYVKEMRAFCFDEKKYLLRFIPQFFSRLSML